MVKDSIKKTSVIFFIMPFTMFTRLLVYRGIGNKIETNVIKIISLYVLLGLKMTGMRMVMRKVYTEKKMTERLK